MASKAVPDGYHTITPQLTFDNCAEAIEWYKMALGAEEVGGRALGPDGKIMHAELQFGDSKFMVNDAMMGGKGPLALGGSPISLWLYVDDCDSLFDRAIAAGGEVWGEMGRMQDQFWGDRSGTFKDPHGYRWTIASHKEDLTREELKQRMDDWMRKFAPQYVNK